MKKKRILASICAACMCFALAGCSDTSWAVKTDSVTIPTGVYTYYLIVGAQQVSAQAQAASQASSSSTATTSSSNKSSSSDIWSQSISGTNAVTWTMNQALDECKNFAAIEKLCKDKKITLTADQKKNAESSASTYYTQNKDGYAKNDISQASLQRIIEDSYLQGLLFTSIYGKGGEKAVADKDVTDYYTKNYAHVKQIFVGKIDTSTRAALSTEKVAEQKTKAEKALAEAKANPSKFDELVKTYNEDPGMTQNADGYIFSKSTAEQQGYDTKFTDLAFSLKEGEVGMSESDMGWFIEMRVKTDPSDTKTYTDSVKTTILSEMKGAEFTAYLKDQVSKLKFDKNDAAMNKYNPKSLKLS